MKSTFKILFYLRSNRVNKKTGLSSIMIRITINGDAKQFNSKLEIDQSLWDPNNGKAKGRSSSAVEINLCLEDVKATIYLRHKEFSESLGKLLQNSLKALF